MSDSIELLQLRRKLDDYARIEDELQDKLARVTPVAFPLEAWTEEDGPALWWKFPVVEPPYVGSPLSTDFPGYVTHWTRIVVSEVPR